MTKRFTSLLLGLALSLGATASQAAWQIGDLIRLGDVRVVGAIQPYDGTNTCLRFAVVCVSALRSDNNY